VEVLGPDVLVHFSLEFILFVKIVNQLFGSDVTLFYRFNDVHEINFSQLLDKGISYTIHGLDVILEILFRF
jgi:hypothetical protein